MSMMLFTVSDLVPNLKNMAEFSLTLEVFIISMRLSLWKYVHLLLVNMSHRFEYIAMIDDILVCSLTKHHMYQLESPF